MDKKIDRDKEMNVDKETDRDVNRNKEKNIDGDGWGASFI